MAGLEDVDETKPLNIRLDIRLHELMKSHNEDKTKLVHQLLWNYYEVK